MQLWMMKMMHHWFGVAFSAFFFVICMSGVAVTVTEQIVPSVFKSEFRGALSPLTPQGAAEAVTQIDDSVDGPLLQIGFPVRGRAVYRVELEDGRAFYFDQDSYARLGSAERTGLVKGLWSIHANLLNLFGIGRSIVTITGLVGVYLGLLGLLIFIPQWRGFRRKEVLRPKSLTFRDMRRSHMSSGIVFGGFVIFFGLTGWGIGAPDDVRAIFSEKAQAELADLSNASAQRSTAGGYELGDLVSAVMTKALSDNTIAGRPTRIDFPDLAGADNEEPQIVIYYSQTGDLSLQGHYRASFNASDGTLSAWQDGRTASRGARFGGVMAALHSGESLPLIYKVILCVFGLIAGIIALTGLLSYVLKWKMKLSRILQRRAASAANRPKE